jgi:hypothetical protein
MTTSQFYQTHGRHGPESAIWGHEVIAGTDFALSAVSIARATPWN